MQILQEMVKLQNLIAFYNIQSRKKHSNAWETTIICLLFGTCMVGAAHVSPTSIGVEAYKKAGATTALR